MKRGFLNEASLQEALNPGALEWLHEIVTELSNAHLDFTFFLKRSFFEKGEFKASFNGLPFKSSLTRAAIRRLIFSPQVFADWHPIRLSDPAEIYRCLELEDIFSDDSQCEAAEQGLQDQPPGLLLNAEGTRWAEFHELGFEKHGGGTHTVPSIANRRTADLYLVSCHEYYAEESVEPPRDCQTILLKEPDRFRRTNKTERNGKRQVFLDTKSGFYFYVDNLHGGLSAHLEAFDSNEKHLGEADINSAEIKPETKRDRWINW